MYSENKIWIAKSGEERCEILTKMANRHGLIAGATGTGKTITLKVLAESFSDAGVPVFLADVKGDLAGMCRPGIDSEDMQKRIEKFGLAEAGFDYHAYPTTFWDILGKQGLPLRTTVSEFGPLLFARILELNKTQSDLLDIVFRIADDEELLLLDLKDLRAMLNFVEEHAAEYRPVYGNISKASIGVIMRSLVALEDRGADLFFGEPAIDIHDWFTTDAQGRGMINILDSTSLINDPMIYSTFMLWLLTELFEIMPEAGDPEKPKMVFFFDEAHLLFKSAPKALLDKIEQVMKLIRSKGIGVFFITQNPSDIPGGVLAQLGNKIQHALRAYTPAEQKGIRAAASSFRVNPEFDTATVLQELKTAEAIVSFLDEDGAPTICKKAKILPPQSQMGPIDDITRQAAILAGGLRDKYATMIDRDSAYEFLVRLNQEQAAAARKAAEEAEAQKQAEKEAAEAEKQAQKEAAAAEKQAQREAAAAQKQAEKEAAAAEKEKQREAMKKKRAAASVGNAAAGTVGREIGNTIGKTVGGSFGKKIGGNVGASLGRGILKTFLGL
ncbi:MAG: DUF853 family protein [Stomatobaculum sp.]|nr:DUF853 family protein [Stomatobaculum sp.]